MQQKPKRPVPPLLPPAAALASGILAARYFEYFPVSITVACLIAIFAVSFLKRLRALQLVLACLFLVAGFASYYSYGPGAPSYAAELARRGESAVEGLVTRAPQEREGYTVVYLRPLNVPKGFRRAGLIRLSVGGTGLGIRYKDTLAGELRLRRPMGLRNPGTFDWGDYARLNGVDAQASAKPRSLYRTGNRAGLFMGRVHAFRRSLIDRAGRFLDYPAEAMFRALILGDQGAVDEHMREVFSASGTTHILSVSGSHIALLSGAVFFGVGALFGLLPPGWALRLSLRLDMRKLAAAVTIPAAVSYCLIAGSETATVRATIMVCMFLVSILIDRQNQVINTLSAAALVVLVLDPFAIFDISFRLSYVAVLFIALALDGIRNSKFPSVTGRPRVDGLIRKASVATAMSVAAIAGTAPLVARQFNSFSYAALPANLALMPLTGALAVPAGLASCLISAVSPGDGLPLAWLNTAGLDAFYHIVGLFARVPFANLHPAAPGPLLGAAYYAVAVAALMLLGSPAKKTAALFLATAGFIAVCIIRPGDGLMRVCFLDTGQGECAVAELPSGETMLIDCGGPPVGADPGRAAAAPYLWNRGKRTVDYVVVSHPQSDHVSGLSYILAGFDVGQVWEGGVVSDDKSYVSFRNEALAKGVPHYVLPAGYELMIGDVTVQAIHCAASGSDDAGLDLDTRINNRSLALRLVYGDVSFLFTGDAEKEAQYAMLGSGLPLKSTVLKVPHHGSPDACLPAFLNSVSPRVAVISAGRANSFGHPWPGTVGALRSAGASAYCTANDGAVTVTTDGASLEVDTVVSGRLRPARGWRDELDNIKKLAWK